MEQFHCILLRLADMKIEITLNHSEIREAILDYIEGNTDEEFNAAEVTLRFDADERTDGNSSLRGCSVSWEKIL